MPLRLLGSWLRRRRKTSTALVLLLGLPVGAWAGVKLWAAQHLKAAENAWQEDRLDDARAHIKACARFCPLESHLLGARIERLVGSYREAEKHLRECKDIEGISSQIQLEWVLLRALQGELTDLEPALWEMIKMNARDTSRILETLAICYMREFRYRGAAYCLDKLLEREPDSLRALDWRTWVWEKVENREGVFQDCRRALELCPSLWKVRLRLAWALLTDGNPPAASEHIRILQQTHADSAEVQLAFARWQMLTARTSEARQTLDTILAKNPEFPVALLYRGKVAEDTIQQEKYFRRALEKDPFSNDAWYALYSCLMVQKRVQEAKEVKARLERNKKDFRKLKESFEDLETRPAPAAFAQIAEIYLDLGIPDNAKLFYLKVLKLDPDNRRAREVVESLTGKTASGPKKK